MSRYFPSKVEEKLWKDWEKVPKEELLEIILEKAMEDGLAETSAIIESYKKQLGMKYEIPNTYSKEYLLEGGTPEAQMVKVREKVI